MPKATRGQPVGPPAFVAPQLCRLVETPPPADGWLHEIKFDGYRMHARINRGKEWLLTRTGLDWTDRYRATAAALSRLVVRDAYLDGELCAVDDDGVTSFAAMQAATDERRTAELVYFVFDLLWLDGEDLSTQPLVARKERLETLLKGAQSLLRYSEHVVGNGPEALRSACGLGVEGIVSKRADAAYVPGNRGIWTKSKCLNRQEFIVVGWTPPKGSRGHIGALLLGYYDAGSRLVYAGRVGSGLTDSELADLAQRLAPLEIKRMPLATRPPRETRFGSPLELSRVHWVRPELVVEITFSTWTRDGLLRQTVYQGFREDKPAREVRLERPARR